MNRLAPLAVIVAAIAPVLLAVLSMLSLEAQTYDGAVTVVKITENDRTTSAAEAASTVARAAARGGFDVGREVVDLRAPETERHLYLALGSSDSPRATWLTSGYPDFSGRITTNAEPIAQLPSTDPRGYYYVFGSSDAGVQLERAFAKVGLTGVQIPLGTAIENLPLVLPTTTWAVIASTALGLLVLGIATPTLRTRDRAVTRLMGYSLVDVLRRDVRRARWWFLVFPVTWVVVIASAAVRGWPQWGTLLTVSGTFTAAALALLCTAHVGASALAFRGSLGSDLSGRRPTSRSALVIGVARIPAMVLAVSAIAVSVASAAHLEAYRTSASVREAAGRAVTVEISGSVSEAELGEGPRSVWDRFGGWLGRADADGEMILTAVFDLAELGDESGPNAPVLFVNDTYLDRHPVPGASAPATGATVFVPAGSTLDDDMVLRRAASGAQLKLGIDRSSIAVERAAVPTRLYTYASPGRVAPAWVEAPVIVAVSGAVLQHRDNAVTLASWMSTGDVVLADERWTRGSLQANDLTDAVLSVQLIAQAAADAERRLVSEMVIGLMGTALSCMTAGLAAATSITARSARQRRRTVVQCVNGWSFLRAKQRAVSMEIAMFGFACGVAWINRQRLAPDVRGLNLELDPSVASATTALLLAVTGAGLLAAGAIALDRFVFHRSAATSREDLT